MSRRRPRRPAKGRPPLPIAEAPLEEWRGELFAVRRVTGAASTRAYRCPGCDHEIRPATPHVVAWPDGELDLRRHWHTACWAARETRRPTR